MFKKPFKIKTNSQIKGSERKNLKDNILKSFRALSEADIEEILPKKEVINSIKILTANNETLQIYTVGKRPLFFDIRGALFPTIYFLWKQPNLLHNFTVHAQVMTYITSGADLMLPGVLPPPSHTNLSKYGNLSENQTACVNLSHNRAAVAVGVTAQSSASMASSGGKGKCLIIYHCLGDKLCTIEGMAALQAPNLGPPDWLQLGSYDDDFPQLGREKAATAPVHAEPAPETAETDEEKCADEGAEKVATPTPDEMDDLLKYCFFVAIKYSKSLVLPILTSSFFKLQMLPVCPDDKSLDIKKSSFKKLKPFLDSMSKDGIITIKEVKKGVETITFINKEHARFSEFYVEPKLRPKKEENKANDASATSVTESYMITPNVLPIFAETGLNKGDVVQAAEIRKHVVEYVRRHNCQESENKKLVRPKEALVKICKTENNVTWEEVMENVCEAMKSCFKVASGNEEILNKGKVSPIFLSISQRSGNKKVTLVDNLELFGIRIGDFAKECQHGVAASTSISRPPGKKCDQLLVQGNQILFIHSLLTDKYKISPKYIRGLEFAPKKRK